MGFRELLIFPPSSKLRENPAISRGPKNLPGLGERDHRSSTKFSVWYTQLRYRVVGIDIRKELGSCVFYEVRSSVVRSTNLFFEIYRIVATKAERSIWKTLHWMAVLVEPWASHWASRRGRPLCAAMWSVLLLQRSESRVILHQYYLIFSVPTQNFLHC